jgi:hypothetical protein
LSLELVAISYDAVAQTVLIALRRAPRTFAIVIVHVFKPPLRSWAK